MRSNNFRYLVRSGIRNLWSNRMMSIASVGTLMACLIIVGVASLLSINMESIVRYVGEQNEIVVFLNLDAPEGYNVSMRGKLKNIEGLGDVEYVSKEKAMDDVINKYLDGDEGLMEGMENDFLPESFRAKILAPERLDDILKEINGMEHILKVDAPTDLSDTLLKVRTMVNTLGGAIIAALVIVSLVIVVNTIRASVFSRRHEINIMKYIGANNAFIRLPFMVEGVALGLIAAILAFFAVLAGYNVFLSAIATNSTSWLASISESIVPFSKVAFKILGAFLLSGIAVGGLGSVLCMREHLKV